MFFSKRSFFVVSLVFAFLCLFFLLAAGGEDNPDPPKGWNYTIRTSLTFEPIQYDKAKCNYYGTKNSLYVYMGKIIRGPVCYYEQDHVGYLNGYEVCNLLGRHARQFAEYTKRLEQNPEEKRCLALTSKINDETMEVAHQYFLGNLNEAEYRKQVEKIFAENSARIKHLEVNPNQIKLTKFDDCGESPGIGTGYVLTRKADQFAHDPKKQEQWRQQIEKSPNPMYTRQTKCLETAKKLLSEGEQVEFVAFGDARIIQESEFRQLQTYYFQYKGISNLVDELQRNSDWFGVTRKGFAYFRDENEAILKEVFK